MQRFALNLLRVIGAFILAVILSFLIIATGYQIASYSIFDVSMDGIGSIVILFSLIYTLTVSSLVFTLLFSILFISIGNKKKKFNVYILILFFAIAIVYTMASSIIGFGYVNDKLWKIGINEHSLLRRFLFPF